MTDTTKEQEMDKLKDKVSLITGSDSRICQARSTSRRRASPWGPASDDREARWSSWPAGRVRSVSVSSAVPASPTNARRP
jgi:hypothetical protein